jgi:hypothetical protein
VFDATGQGPFGFTFTKAGALLTTEQFDGPDGRRARRGRGLHAECVGRADADERLGRERRHRHLLVRGHDNGLYGYTTSFFEGGRISLYRWARTARSRARRDGGPWRGRAPARSDMALSLASDYLYQLQPRSRGTINQYRVGADRRLTLTQTVHAHRAEQAAAADGPRRR